MPTTETEAQQAFTAGKEIGALSAKIDSLAKTVEKIDRNVEEIHVCFHEQQRQIDAVKSDVKNINEDLTKSQADSTKKNEKTIDRKWALIMIAISSLIGSIMSLIVKHF